MMYAYSYAYTLYKYTYTYTAYIKVRFYINHLNLSKKTEYIGRPTQTILNSSEL